MRAALLGLAMVLGAVPASAGVVVLKDGRALRYAGALRREGALVYVSLEDGTFVSMKQGLVDWTATERAQAILGEAAPRRPQPEPRRGPRELESLPERTLLQALVHTGRRSTHRGPGEELEPAPQRQVVDLLLEPDPTSPREPVPLPAPPRTRGTVPREASPYTGAASADARPDALARLTPLADPLRIPEPVPAPSTRLVDPRARNPRDDGRSPRFVSPRDGEAVIGETRLEVRPAAGGAALRSVEFRVDGTRLGRVEEEPFEIAWSAPADRANHDLEAILERADGRVERTRARVFSVVPDVAVDVELVPLAVSVSNHAYMFVRELVAADFVVFEDGVRQEVAHFSRDPVPLTVLVAIDVSWSMHGRKLEMAAEGVARLAQRLGPDDRIGVVAFGDEVRVLAPISTDHERAAHALDGIAADGGTAMFAAEMEVLRLLEPEGGKRSLIVLGDGEDYLSYRRLPEAIASAQRLNVTIYSVGLLTYRLKDGIPEHWSESLEGRARPAYWSDQMRVRGLKMLRRQSDETGGVLYLPKFTGELPYVFEHLLAEMKSAYSLGYYPTNRRRDGGFRAIDVFVDGVGLTARTRKGYYAPGGAGAASAPRASAEDSR